MIVIDTNVLSEVMAGGSGVDRWYARTPPRDIYTTVMTRAEIRYGLALLPAGRRRRNLTEQANFAFETIRDRLLPFDTSAADRYGELMAERDCRGRPMSVPDAVIASITWAHRATLATRNTKDFEGCDVDLVNPFGP